MSTGAANTNTSSVPSKNRRNTGPHARGVSLTALLVLITWGGVAAIGAVGIVHPRNYHTAAPPKAELPPVELIKVELTNDPIVEAATASAVNLPLPLDTPAEPPPSALEIPNLPQPIPVAAPETVAFALPVEGPVQVVEAPRAAYTAPAEPKTEAKAQPVSSGNIVPPPTHLTYGQGAGKQPAPDYPYQAIRRNQTGTVRVRFTVGENGRVTEAEAVQPCEWDLLNNSAVSSIRNRWRFAPGQPRVYEVDIRFELK